MDFCNTNTHSIGGGVRYEWYVQCNMPYVDLYLRMSTFWKTKVSNTYYMAHHKTKQSKQAHKQKNTKATCSSLCFNQLSPLWMYPFLINCLYSFQVSVSLFNLLFGNRWTCKAPCALIPYHIIIILSLINNLYWNASLTTHLNGP